MSEIQRQEYAAYASFELDSVTWAYATRTLLRDGVWHQAGLAMPMLPDRASGLSAGGDINLAIDDPAGQLRAAMALTPADGTPVAVTLETVLHFTDGTSSTLTHTTTLTLSGSERSPGRVSLLLRDLEPKRLEATYPEREWRTEDWPRLWVEDVGRPMAVAVGIALKIPCAWVQTQAANLSGNGAGWWYGVAEAVYTRLAITAVNTGARRFTVAGDHRPLLWVGRVIEVVGGDNAGLYTVESFDLDAGTTRMVVAETVESATVAGAVDLSDRVLTVYRANRVVSGSEWSQRWLAGNIQFNDPNFEGGGDWDGTTLTTGTGDVAIGGGEAVLTSAGSGNAATLFQFRSGAIVGRVYAAVFEVTAGTVWVTALDAWDGNATAYGVGRHTHLMTAATTFLNLTFRVANDSGTATLSYCQLLDYDALLLRFLGEQLDFGGGAYDISADVQGGRSRNVAREIERLLTHAGAAVDSTSFAAAATVADTEVMRVDCAYREPRTLSAILTDLLFIARGHLRRTAAGAYGIWQDVVGSPVGLWDEGAGDLVRMRRVVEPPRPERIKLRYRPNPREPDRLQHTLERTVQAGAVGTNERDVIYLRDHEAADRLACYWALREAYHARAECDIYAAHLAAGEVVTLASAGLLAASPWRVWDLERVEAGNRLTARIYDAAIYSYTPGELPPDAQVGYGPDYSATPPVAPTAMALTDMAVAVALDGVGLVWIEVQAVPPALNWAELRFFARNVGTGELYTGLGGDLGGGVYGVTIPGLRPSALHELLCYATNAFGVEGFTQGTFDATAVGGGATDTTFTTPVFAGAPATPSSCSAGQGTGRWVVVEWTGVTVANLADYELQRKVGAGAYTTVWTGRARDYVDNVVSYGQEYQYRVRARDTSGNTSSTWAESGVVEVIPNVAGGLFGDITLNSVSPDNRTNTTALTTTVNDTDFSADGVATKIMAHSLGRIPIVASILPGFTGVLAQVVGVSDTNVTIRLQAMPGFYTSTEAPNNPHDHELIFGPTDSSATLTVRIW